MKFFPKVKDEVLMNIEHSLVMYLLTEGNCSDCDNCIICMKRALHLTDGNFDKLKEQILVRIQERCTPDVTFFEVHHGGNREYYTKFELAQARVSYLSEYNIDAILVGRNFQE